MIGTGTPDAPLSTYDPESLRRLKFCRLAFGASTLPQCGLTGGRKGRQSRDRKMQSSSAE